MIFSSNIYPAFITSKMGNKNSKKKSDNQKEKCANNDLNTINTNKLKNKNNNIRLNNKTPLETLNDMVNGYVRENIEYYIPNGIINIIIKFYGIYNIMFNSDIIPNNIDKTNLMKLLCKQLDNNNIKLDRLYSSKINEFNDIEYHKICDNKGACIHIIKNEYDYIFGGYTSLGVSLNGYESDSSAFLYVLHPNINVFPLKKEHINSSSAIYNADGIFVSFNGLGDLWIQIPDNKPDNWCDPRKYSMQNAAQLVGGDPNKQRVKFEVIALETFKVIIDS